MSRDYVDLSNLDKARRWDKMLSQAVELYAQNFFNEYESNFVKRMIDADANDRPVWNPTLRQYNFLHDIINFKD